MEEVWIIPKWKNNPEMKIRQSFLILTKQNRYKNSVLVSCLILHRMFTICCVKALIAHRCLPEESKVSDRDLVRQSKIKLTVLQTNNVTRFLLNLTVGIPLKCM